MLRQVKRGQLDSRIHRQAFYLRGVRVFHQCDDPGNAGGVHNVIVQPGPDDFSAMLKRMGTGLLVTELMGQGVSLISGDYSRGAAGFWVENGAIAYPVEEITIASNLRDMFAGIVAIGNDADHRSHLLTGSILIERMMIAGE